MLLAFKKDVSHLPVVTGYSFSPENNIQPMPSKSKF
jgi:hypothetical protein